MHLYVGCIVNSKCYCRCEQLPSRGGRQHTESLECHGCFESFGCRLDQMVPESKLCVHLYPRDRGFIFGSNLCSFDRERPSVVLLRIAGEVNNTCLFAVESGSTPFLPVQICLDDCLDAFPVGLCRGPCDLRGVVVHKCHRITFGVDFLLDQVGIEKQEEDG